MAIKDAVKEIEASKDESVSLRMCRGELFTAMTALNRFREISNRYYKMDYGIPDEHLDFWTLADVRAESIEEKLKLLSKQLEGDSDE